MLMLSQLYLINCICLTQLALLKLWENWHFYTGKNVKL